MTEDVTPKEPVGAQHLGDGAYISYDGWHYWLGANSAGNMTVALEPSVLENMMRYIRVHHPNKARDLISVLEGHK